MPRKKQEILALFEDAFNLTQDLTDQQFGELMRAIGKYRFGGVKYTGNDFTIKMAFGFISAQVDRYSDYCQSKRDAANARHNKDSAEECTGVQETQNDAEECTGVQNVAKDPSISISMSMSKSISMSESISEDKADKPPAPTKAARKSYGEFGWVKLTDDEYNRLLNDLGEAEAKRCIAYVDESAQSTSNKNKWRDWNLVVRKCHKHRWGLNQRGSQTAPSRKESSLDQLARIYQEDFT